MLYLLLFIIGISLGSFLAAYAWRYERQLTITNGRSYCDHCKKKIPWFDNIPLLSYFLLSGRSRCCSKHISVYYPIVELVCGLLFVALPHFTFACFTSSSCLIPNANLSSMVFMAFVLAILSAIFLVDFLTLTIPDQLSYLLLALAVVFSLFYGVEDVYDRLFIAFTCAAFLLAISLVTKGKGMGLGDVKLALPLGFILGLPNALVWLYTSFLVGGLVAIILVLGKFAKLKAKIAFGPFLVIGFFITMVIGDTVAEYVFGAL